jgi:hypothetical protein
MGYPCAQRSTNGLLDAPPFQTALRIVGSDPQGNRLTFELPSGSVSGCPLRSLSNRYRFSEEFGIRGW